MPSKSLIKLKKGAGISGPPLKRKEGELVLIVAGEASADFHGANLISSMKRRHPVLVFQGVGGRRMEQAGAEILFSSSEMAVVGLTEVLARLKEILRALHKLKSMLKNDRPDLLILIDYPDFNIHLARTAKRFHVPVLYYIAPQVWAWRKSRVRKIRKRVDRMAVILPFEEDFYKRRGMKVEYVGHPILDGYPPSTKKDELRRQLGIGEVFPVLGLLPGSRKEEIRNMLPPMVGAAEILVRRYPGLHCVIPVASTIEPELIRSFLGGTSLHIHVLEGDIHEILGICHAAMVTSGTATLDAALAGVPMVVAYKVSNFTYWLGRIVVKVPFISLVNLVAGEEVVKELIQGEVTSRNLSKEILEVLDNDAVRVKMIGKLEAVRKRLGGGGASERTAEIALTMINRNAPEKF